MLTPTDVAQVLNLVKEGRILAQSIRGSSDQDQTSTTLILTGF